MAKENDIFWHRNLLKCKLFKNLEKKDVRKIIFLLKLQSLSYKKDEIIVQQNAIIECVYLLLEGSVELVHDDLLREHHQVDWVEKTHEFFYSESINRSKSFYNAIARADNTEVLRVNYQQIKSDEQLEPKLKEVLIQNVFDMLIERTIDYQRQFMYMEKRTIREKVWNYLLDHFEDQKDAAIIAKGIFTVPHNRVEMAKYLGIDRSAMSRELARLRDEGLIEFYKNFFKFGFVD